MNAKTKSLLDEARKLPPRHQLELAEELLAFLDIGTEDPDADLLSELDERWQALERGDDKGVDAFEAIDEMRSALKGRSAK